MGIFSYVSYSWGEVFVMIAFISFLGFLLENLWLAARKGYMDNRNMYAPFLIGYGIAVMGIYLVMGTPSNMWIFGTPPESGPKSRFGAYFILTFILVSVGEIILGKITEKLTHVIWWDYTKIPLHITRYTSVPTSIGFTIIIVTFMDCFFERIMNRLSEMDETRMTVFGTILMIVMTADFLYNFTRMILTHKMMTSWRIDLQTKSIHRYKHNEQ